MWILSSTDRGVISPVPVPKTEVGSRNRAHIQWQAGKIDGNDVRALTVMIGRLGLLAGALLAVVFALSPRAGIAAPIGSAGNFIVISESGITEFDGASGQSLGSFSAHRPNDFVFSGNRLYATDTSDHIVVYDAVSGDELGTLSGPAAVRNAGSIAVDLNGDLLLLNQVSGSISLDRFLATGEFAETISSLPLSDFVLSPSGMLFGTTSTNLIVEIDPANGSALTIASGLANPGPIAFLGDGTLVVRDSYGLQRFGIDGFAFGLFSSVIANDMALGPDGNLYITHSSDSVMVLHRATGEVLATYSTPASPSSIAFRSVSEPTLLPILSLVFLGLQSARRVFVSKDA